MDFIKFGKLREQKVDKSTINGLLQSAKQNFLAAQANCGRFDEVAFKAAYDGVLQLSRCILFINGYRPDDGGQHKTTFQVAGLFLGKEFNNLIKRIDRYRRRRNESIYHPIDFISASEAKAVIQSAQEYHDLVSVYLKQIDPQLELFKWNN